MKYLVLIFLTISGNIAFGQNYNLAIKIPNLKNTEGNIEIGIYNKKENFPKEEKQYKLVKFKANNSSGIYTINNLPKGEYAIAIFHDKNTDGICNTNFMGIPNEGYGFSNNIRPLFSAPSFNECKINLKTDLSITIKLIY
jgi:uncharacterized protein (DUF2141 family)